MNTDTIDILARLAFTGTKLNGGVTIRARRDGSIALPESGFAVGAFKSRERIVDAKAFSIGTLRDYLAENSDILDDTAGIWDDQHAPHVGTWEHDGKVYLDISLVCRDVSEALRIAREHNELAIFDLGAKREIAVTVPA